MTRKLLRELRREFPGATITITGRSHYRVTLANGRAVFVSGTPSCQRFLHNARADLRRLMKNDEGGQQQ